MTQDSPRIRSTPSLESMSYILLTISAKIKPDGKQKIETNSAKVGGLELPTSFSKWRRVAHTRTLPSENEGRGCCKTNSMRSLELPTDFSTGGKQSLKLPTSFAKWRSVAHTRALPTENEGRGCCKPIP
ncbi:unnamed protein product [Rhizophagus irregularis]|nr:unnamed protein product [Rhizophagus irregularis]